MVRFSFQSRAGACVVSAPSGLSVSCRCPQGALRVPSVSILPAGVQRQVVHCVERLAGLVEERFCDALTRPDDQQRTCSEEPCPARCDPTLLLPSPSLWGWVPGCVGP